MICLIGHVFSIFRSATPQNPQEKQSVPLMDYVLNLVGNWRSVVLVLCFVVKTRFSWMDVILSQLYTQYMSLTEDKKSQVACDTDVPRMWLIGIVKRRFLILTQFECGLNLETGNSWNIAKWTLNHNKPNQTKFHLIILQSCIQVTLLLICHRNMLSCYSV